jgi:hypothetical protein
VSSEWFSRPADERYLSLSELARTVRDRKIAAKAVMRSRAHPEHIEIDERREGVIAFIDSVTPDGRQALIEDVAFDDDRIRESSRA